MGYDYYNLIYGATGLLCCVMLYLYFVVEDEELKNMVMMQGALSIFLLVGSMYFRKNLHMK